MKLFGTDGIRGVFNETINCSTAYKLGICLVELSKEEAPIIIIGRDTRLSGGKLLSALATGIIEKGGKPINIGILPTNAVSYFVRITNAAYGVMVSASHNPPQYNGLKVFDKYGIKICAEKEKLIEDMFIQDIIYIDPILDLPYIKNAQNMYIRYLLKHIGILSNVSVTLDCCFGSASYTAPKAFESIGALVIKINNEYNGAYINKNCGATVTECMLTEQKHYKTDLAFSFDGDADRLAVYENGEIIEPNYVFYVIAKYMQEIGELKGKAVGTILTNEGLELSLNKIGIELFRSEVGDANVFRLMVKKGTVFGGEDSGHYMLTKYTLTSDAILNALFITKIHNEKGSIKDYGKELTLFPSCNLSIPWFDDDNERIERIKKAVKLKYPTIRTIIRKSGTEPKLRILAESSSTDLSSICSSIADLCEEIK